MKADGTKGSYRESYVDYSPYKINCSACGLLKEIVNGNEYQYELWFKVNFKSHSLWAYNIEHIDSLIHWLSKGNRIPGDYFESLPKWMVTNRQQVIKKLEKMKIFG